jgi:hypothetical protein
MPPVNGKSEPTEEGSGEGSGRRSALSLLGRRPNPIHLATIVGEVDDMPVAGPGASADPPVAERGRPPPLAAPAPLPSGTAAPPPSPTVPAAPLRIASRVEHADPTQRALPALQPVPTWRQPAPLALFLLIVGACGVAFGVWLSRERAQKTQDAERAAFRALVGFKRAAIQGRSRAVVADAGATATPEERVDAGGRPPLAKVRHKLVRTVRKPAAPAPCLVTVRGEGLEDVALVVDGHRVAGKLPLPGPLALDPTRPHRVLARRRGFQAFQTTLSCEPGEELTIRLKLRPE